MKAIRVTLFILGVVLVLAAGAVWFLLSNLDAIVEAAIVKYGSQVTKTDVGVSSVNIKLKEGEGAISGLTVGNPSGFTAPNIFTLGNIKTKLDVETITKDPLVIDEIFVGAPKVVYEINKAGKSNLDVIKNNISGAETEGPSTPPEAEKSTQGPKIIIRRLVVEEGQISAKISALPKQDLSASFPRIELKDIGDKQQGSTVDEIAKQIVAVLVKQVGVAVSPMGVEKYLGKSVDQLKNVTETLNNNVRKEIGGQLDRLRDTLSK